MLMGNHLHRPLGQSGNRCEGVHSEGSWHYGSITYDKSLVDLRSLPHEELALVVDTSVSTRPIIADACSAAVAILDTVPVSHGLSK